MIKREVMGELDARLQVLEDASERGDVVVSRRLARILASAGLSIEIGMPIEDAIEVAFREQETVMAQRPSGTRPSSDRGRAWMRPASRVASVAGSDARALLRLSAGRLDLVKSPLDAQEARLLTQRIKTEMNQVCQLLAEANDRRAWAALGYATWDQYVRNDIGLQPQPIV
jgi:hypothetical protein